MRKSITLKWLPNGKRGKREGKHHDSAYLKHSPGVKIFAKEHRKGLAAALLLITANLALWKLFVLPGQAELVRMESLHALHKIKPQLEALITQSEGLISDWEKQNILALSPESALKDLQEAARQHAVRIRETRLEPAPKEQAKTAKPGIKSVPVKMTLTGNYNNLARWISSVESNSCFRIENWRLYAAPSSREAHSAYLNIEIHILLRNL